MKKLIFLVFLALFSSMVYGAESCDINEAVCDVNPVSSIPSTEEFNIVMEHDPNAVCIIYFYGDGCSQCAKVKGLIDELETKYGNNVSIVRLEVYNNLRNYQLYNDYCSIQNIPIEDRGIPLVAIDDTFFMGSTSIKDNLENKIDETLKKDTRVCPLGDQMGCHSNINSTKEDTNPLIPSLKDKVTMPVVLVAGLVDGINPCAFAVLIFLLAFLLQISSNRKRMIYAGSVYIFAVYLSYFLVGLGLLSVVQLTGLSAIIVKIAAAFAIIAGLINIKDYFWYGKGISLKIPESKKGIIERWVKKANVPAALILGFLVSMFELPCTGGIYLAILAMLSSTVTHSQAIVYLLVYNLMFVLPLIIILLAVVFGMKAEHIENWKESKKNGMRLLMGLILLALGLALLFGIF